MHGPRLRPDDLAPAVAVVGGVVLPGEPLTAAIVAGLLLVLADAWLSSGRRPPAVTAPLASSSAARS